MEIERKFLVKSLPEDLENYTSHKLEQGYISTSPVIRIRRQDDAYILTVKSKGLLKRQEFEINISESDYNNLLKKVSGNIISKTRYVIPIENNLKIELDIFERDFEGLCYAEVEFPDEESAKKYNPPAFFGREVTYDNSYHNSSLSSMDKSLIFDFVSKVRLKNC